MIFSPPSPPPVLDVADGCLGALGSVSPPFDVVGFEDGHYLALPPSPPSGSSNGKQGFPLRDELFELRGHGEHVFARHLVVLVNLLLNFARWHAVSLKLPSVQINGENPGLLGGDGVADVKIYQPVGQRPHRFEHRFHDDGWEGCRTGLLKLLLEYLF